MVGACAGKGVIRNRCVPVFGRNGLGGSWLGSRNYRAGSAWSGADRDDAGWGNYARAGGGDCADGDAGECPEAISAPLGPLAYARGYIPERGYWFEGSPARQRGDLLFLRFAVFRNNHLENRICKSRLSQEPRRHRGDDGPIGG